jgi:hypothetical protein
VDNSFLDVHELSLQLSQSNRQGNIQGLIRRNA